MPTTISTEGREAVCTGLLLLALSAWPQSAGQPARANIACRPEGPLVRVADLPEGSGVAAGRQQQARAWAHNDSGKPAVVALDERGTAVGTFQLSGANVQDWEAMATGPCPSGSCVYVGDIGDNDAERERIVIYRFPEPRETSGTIPVQQALHARYPDGRHDAETLLVTPEGEIFIVTKGETGPVALYRLPTARQSTETVELVRVGRPRDNARSTRADRITDGAVSPNGDWIALRTVRYLSFFSASELLSGNWREAARIDLTQFGERQGEGVTFADDRTLILVGEGGGKSQPGTYLRLSCTF